MRTLGSGGQWLFVWWIRDMFYRPAGRVVIIISLVAAASVGAYFGATRLLFTSSSPTTTVAPDAQGGPGGAADPSTLSPGGQVCTTALLALNRIVDTTKSAANMGQEAKIDFSRALLQAHKNCTYREYVAFENNVLLKWTGGLPVPSGANDPATTTEPPKASS